MGENKETVVFAEAKRKRPRKVTFKEKVVFCLVCISVYKMMTKIMSIRPEDI